MLQYRYTFLSLSVLAFAGLGSGAQAQAICDLSNGYEATPVAFLAEADSCLEGVDGITPQTFLESELRQFIDQTRDSKNLNGLASLSSLNEAARLHAFDMAARGYAAHDDQEGRSHLDRIRMIDRSTLLGAFGANIAIVDAGSTPAEIQTALMTDANNVGNFVRTSFDHAGVGAVEANGKIYIVELFARVEGRLNSPLPSHVTDRASIKAEFSDRDTELESWKLVSEEGETLARGRGDRITASLQSGQVAYLLLDLAVAGATYTVKGPAANFN